MIAGVGCLFHLTPILPHHGVITRWSDHPCSWSSEHPRDAACSCSCSARARRLRLLGHRGGGAGKRAAFAVSFVIATVALGQLVISGIVPLGVEPFALRADQAVPDTI